MRFAHVKLESEHEQNEQVVPEGSWKKKSLFPFTDVFQLLLKHSAPKHCRRTGFTTHELRFICSTDPAAQFIFEPICSFFVHHVCLVGGTLIYWVTKKHGWTPKLLPLTRLRALATNKGYPKQGSYPTRRKDFVVRGWLASPFLVANNRSPPKSFAQTVLQIWKWFEFTQLNTTTLMGPFPARSRPGSSTSESRPLYCWIP